MHHQTPRRESYAPSLRFVNRGIRGEQRNKKDSSTFTIDRLFEAAASGDVGKLENLHQYLRQNTKKLSDSLCEWNE